MDDLVERLRYFGRTLKSKSACIAIGEAVAEIEALRARCEALERDRERIEWLHGYLIECHESCAVRVVVGDTAGHSADGIPIRVLVFTLNGNIGYETLREAIDAARAASAAGEE